MSIVTKTGDRGETGLVGNCRVSKADVRMHAIGTVDELNAYLGVVLVELTLSDAMKSGLTRIQNELFTLGADLATPDAAMKVPRITPEHVGGLEEWITALESILLPLSAFILPGGSRTGSSLHYARTVCRRAERYIVALAKEEPTNPNAQIYLNRLSDLLFLLARAVNKENGAGETEVRYEEV